MFLKPFTNCCWIKLDIIGKVVLQLSVGSFKMYLFAKNIPKKLLVTPAIDSKNLFILLVYFTSLVFQTQLTRRFCYQKVDVLVDFTSKLKI